MSLESGRSAIVPIVDREVPASRIDLFVAESSLHHPLASIRIQNTTGAGLPPGVLTLYEDTPGGVAYVGDARLNSLPAGEDRLLSYAVDDKIKVVREAAQSTAITHASIAQGVLKLTNTRRNTTTYKIAAPPTEARTLLIDHNKQSGFVLVEPRAAGTEETAAAYRIRVPLAAGESRFLAVVLERPELESLGIGNLEEDKIAEVTASHGIDPAVKQALGELGALRRIISDKTAVAEAIKNELETLTADQARIRDNIAQIDKESPLHKRYIEKLADQETQFETLRARSAEAEEEIRAARAKLDSFIAKLSV